MEDVATKIVLWLSLIQFPLYMLMNKVESGGGDDELFQDFSQVYQQRDRAVCWGFSM